MEAPNAGQVQGHSLTLHFTVVPYWHYRLYETTVLKRAESRKVKFIIP